MHLLKRFIIVLTLFLFSACSPAGPLSPSDSFLAIGSALEKNDIRKLSGLISTDSREKVGRFMKVISSLDDKQLAVTAEVYNVDIDKLRNIDYYGALSLYFNSNEKSDLREIFKQNVAALDVYGKKAVIRTEKGYELDFLKEGPYWKFDLSGL